MASAAPPSVPSARAAAATHDSAAAGSSVPAAIVLHALESIFDFLQPEELALALRVARDWMGAVGSMRRLGLPVTAPAAPPAVVARSAMGRHAGALRSVRLDGADLSALADRMGHLTALDCHLAPPPPDQPISFPAQLRQLDVAITHTIDAGQVNAVVAAIGRLLRLEELSVGMRAMFLQLSLAPLAALPLLWRLEISQPLDAYELSDAQVDQLRALPRLRKLTVNMTTTLLR